MRTLIATATAAAMLIALFPPIGYAKKPEGCDYLRFLLHSSFGINFMPRTMAEKADLWDLVRARPDVECDEPNPFRASQERTIAQPTIPKPDLLVTESVTGPKSASSPPYPTGKLSAPMDCLTRVRTGPTLVKVWNSCPATVTMKHWEAGRCGTAIACLQFIAPNKSVTMYDAGAGEWGACYDCNSDTLKSGDGRRNPPRPAATTPPKVAKSDASKTTDGTPVDEMGRACIAVEKLTPERAKSIYNGQYYMNYKYRVTNSCNRKLTVIFRTNAGKDSAHYTQPGKSSIWQCTDGFFSNPDCHGGASGYRVK